MNHSFYIVMAHRTKHCIIIITTNSKVARTYRYTYMQLVMIILSVISTTVLGTCIYIYTINL